MAENRTGVYFAFSAACVHTKLFPAVLSQFFGVFEHARYMHVHGRAHQVVGSWQGAVHLSPRECTAHSHQQLFKYQVAAELRPKCSRRQDIGTYSEHIPRKSIENSRLFSANTWKTEPTSSTLAVLGSERRAITESVYHALESKFRWRLLVRRHPLSLWWRDNRVRLLPLPHLPTPKRRAGRGMVCHRPFAI